MVKSDGIPGVGIPVGGVTAIGSLAPFAPGVGGVEAGELTEFVELTEFELEFALLVFVPRF